MTRLDFHFDYISPYAYLVWTQLRGLAARHGASIQAIPVLFAGLLDAWGQKGPAEIPPKKLYVFKDASRTARKLGVPLIPPPSHPFNPLLALRVSSLPMEEERRFALIDALYAATWGGAGGVSDPEVVARQVSSVGLDGEALVKAAQEPEAKARLRAQTEGAIARGVFGVPTIFAGDELFWGYDALPHLETYLEGEDVIDAAYVAQWAGLPASAKRPGG